MIISHKHKFIWSFPIGHTASTSLFQSLRHLHDDENFFTMEWEEEILVEGKSTRQKFGVCPDIQGDMHKWASDPKSKMPNHGYLNKHAPISALVEQGFCTNLVNDYTKLAVVRNPYTWFAASLIKDISGINKNSSVNLDRAISYHWQYNKNKNQCDFLGNYDYRLIRFEKLDENIQLLKTKGILPSDVELMKIEKPRDNRSFDGDYGWISNFYSDPSFLCWFHTVFAEDFIRLDYKKEL